MNCSLRSKVNSLNFVQTKTIMYADLTANDIPMTLCILKFYFFLLFQKGTMIKVYIYTVCILL